MIVGIRAVGGYSENQLLFLIDALRLLCGLSCPVQRGEQQARQNGDDRNDDQQLYQRKFYDPHSTILSLFLF